MHDLRGRKGLEKDSMGMGKFDGRGMVLYYQKAMENVVLERDQLRKGYASL